MIILVVIIFCDGTLVHTFYLSERVPNLFDPLLECIRIAVMGPDGLVGTQFTILRIRRLLAWVGGGSLVD